jgi:bifunctional enzyme CysN/CysC
VDALPIDQFLARYEERSLLRFLTCGSVDDGKSTLIGRLLYDSGTVYDDQLEAARRASGKRGATLDLSLLVDGLDAEREQGITIDVAYRYFSTPRRQFIIADTPGHVQYTRNMATGASHCELAVILVDARHGILPQTRRHAFITSLLGIRNFVVAVNKMDAVAYAQDRFEQIRGEFADFAARLQVGSVEFIPVSALHGDNVVHRSERMPWYEGRPLLDFLENVLVSSQANLIDLRFPVQYVVRPERGGRGYAGTIASGILRTSDEIVVLPSLRRSRVAAIESSTGPVAEAFASMAVVVRLRDEVDVSRGDMIAHVRNVPQLAREFEAMVVWMSERELSPGFDFLLKQAAATGPATVTDLRYRMNVESLRREQAAGLRMNEIGRVRVETVRPVAYDPYSRNPGTGSFILIDRISNETVGAGMILDRETDESLGRRRPALDAGSNVHPRLGGVPGPDKARWFRQTPAVVWITGLPRSGKSSVAFGLERALFEAGVTAQVLDGENLRLGLSVDLGFSPADRREAVRRAAEVARLLCGNGVVAIVALVSGSRDDRALARAITAPQSFVEVFCSAPLEVCEGRDGDGLFLRARRGELANVSGIDLPYEAPEAADLVLDTALLPVDENVRLVQALLVSRGLARVVAPLA